MRVHSSVEHDLQERQYCYANLRDADHEIEVVLKCGELLVKYKDSGQWVELINQKVPRAYQVRECSGCACHQPKNGSTSS